MKKKRTVSYFVAFILSLSMSVTFLGKDCKAECDEESLISTTIIDVNVSETVAISQNDFTEPSENKIPEEIESSVLQTDPIDMEIVEETEPQIIYEEVDETVYITTSVNVRSGPSTDYDILEVLNKGDSVKRIGIGENGWSKILINDSECYISSQYLTTTPYDVVYALNDVYIRAGAGTKYDILGILKEGESVLRISSADGWSKVIWNNQECYIGSRHLGEN